MSAERLQKILSEAGVSSRRQAEKLIQDGRVRLNGEIVVQLGVRADWSTDVIEVDGKRISPAPPLYLILNKPYGVITTLADPQGRKTVADLVYAAGITERVYPVGRLDYDTEGLLLLTNDGELTQGLSHPRFEVEKQYTVDVEKQPSSEILRQLASGVILSEGRTAPGKVSEPYLAENGFWRFCLTIHEGRNRQVRRMAEATGMVVRRLKRSGYAFLTLEGLPVGQVRALTPDELIRLKDLAGCGRIIV